MNAVWFKEKRERNGLSVDEIYSNKRRVFNQKKKNQFYVSAVEKSEQFACISEDEAPIDATVCNPKIV